MYSKSKVFYFKGALTGSSALFALVPVRAEVGDLGVEDTKQSSSTSKMIFAVPGLNVVKQLPSSSKSNTADPVYAYYTI